MEGIEIHAKDTLLVMGQHLNEAGLLHHEELWHLDTCLSWLLLGLVLAIVIFLVFNKKAYAFVSKRLWMFALFVFAGGVALYCVGFNDGGSHNNPSVLAFRSIISSMEMFLSHSDMIEIKEELHHDSGYMFLFSLTHFLAVLISALFIIKLLGMRFVSKIKLKLWCWESLFSKNVKDLHVFWGVNENSILLAKSIGKGKRIIFINMVDDNHSLQYSRFSFSHFFHSSNPDVEGHVEEIEEIGALLLNAKKTLRQNIGKAKEKILFKPIGIKNADTLVKRTLNRGKKQNVNFYFLSENERENISAVIELKKLAEENQFYLDNDNFICYCHASRNAVNRSILNTDGLRYNIYLIDSAYLSVLELKKNKEAHPVKYVDVDTVKGVVKTPFTGMVIGFGETGRDVFKFLYEFSSFVKRVDVGDDGKDKIYKQDRKLIVVDSNLEPLKSDFLLEAVKLNDESGIEWCNCSTHSTVFDELVKNNVADLNYVVIAVNDDAEAISLMQKLYTMFVQYRDADNKSKVGIYVRVRGKNAQKTFDRIKYYFDKYNSDSGISINLYGSDEKIFSYNNITNETLEICAKEFFYRYSKESAKLVNDQDGLKRLEATTPAEEWKRRRESKKNSLSDLIDVYYKEEQDRSNVWHIYTKRELLGGDTSDANQRLQQDESLRNTLAYCEHLRWNSKMYLMGFTGFDNDDNENKCDKNKKDMLRKKHPCLLSCDDLIRGENKGTLKYDKGTVILSFSENIEEILKPTAQ